jgi:2,4-dienoyl-CoA reductase-like NADH-dependent reductase (Old Yellow Enzyme family)
MSQPLLFTPIALRELTLKNRVVIAPMHQYAGKDGFATDWHLMNAGRYAAGGAGLVCIESTKVSREGCGTLGDLGLWRDEHVDGLRRVRELVHHCGAKAGIQLGHSGRKARIQRPWEGGKPLTIDDVDPVADDWAGWELVGPSAIAADARSPVPRALTKAEIHRLVEAWGAATRRAEAAGFDMVEIHGAHGFLIHQFLSEHANQRSDEYGGSLGNRMRFAIEVAEHVRSQWPAGKPLFMRLSVVDAAGWELEHSIALARELARAGVDVIDCSGGGIQAGAGAGATPAYGYQVPYAEGLRRDTGVKTMAVGMIVHARQAEAVLQEGRADLVALGREALYNPNWPVDAARKLGVADHFGLMPPNSGWWLSKREGIPGFVPSTFGDSQQA